MVSNPMVTPQRFVREEEVKLDPSIFLLVCEKKGKTPKPKSVTKKAKGTKTKLKSKAAADPIVDTAVNLVKGHTSASAGTLQGTASSSTSTVSDDVQVELAITPPV